MIQHATKEDVNEVMPLLLSAIGNIAYTLTGAQDEEEARTILANFFVQDNNRISYRNVLVDRRDGIVAGMLLSYAGDSAAELDRPIIMRLEKLYGKEASKDLVVEAKAGDFYLDSIAVDEGYRGQGIAQSLIAAFEEQGSIHGCLRLSLIVDPDNKQAESLYRKLGYLEDGRIMVSGVSYIRMIKPIIVQND